MEFPKVTNSQVSKVSTENPFSKCPDIEERKAAKSVVKCYCKGNEIYMDRKCQVYDGAIVIPTQQYWIYTIEVNVVSYNVTVQDIRCDTSKHRYMTFIKNQFHLRPRGDVVLLKEAGELEGQRINNYCIFHHLDKYGDLTWTMKSCVPIPSVPRCCPPGKAMKEGKCEVANTPAVLKPPISAKPFSDGINWESITVYHSPVKCDSEYEQLITTPLGHKQSHLVSLAVGVKNGWVPGYIPNRRVYYGCPDYCVDGINNSDGSVDYFTSFCYSDPKETHKKACAKTPCLRKCCKYGYSIDMYSKSCVPDPNSTFNPLTKSNDYNSTIIIGMPLCTPVDRVKIKKNALDHMGRLIIKDKIINSTDFCVGTLLDNKHRKERALACLRKTSHWNEVAQYLIPICYVISLIFLMFAIVTHVLVPRLLANGGLHQLCHMIALSITYITNFSVLVFRKRFSTHVCFNLAFAMQFGFLTTFFWLNVMCFEIWRKIRRLKNYRPCKSYPNKYYMMYGWGIPFCICICTFMMQKYAPGNVPVVIKPYIDVSRCWFKVLPYTEDISLLIYMYGPKAVLLFFNSVFLVLTYINYKAILRNYKETTNDLRELGAGVTRQQRKRSSCIPLREITNHVHDFNLKLKIFILVAICWIMSLIRALFPWKMQSLQLSALPDTLNSLQGFFLFIILLSNSNKRKHLGKFQNVFRWIKESNQLPANMEWGLQNSVNHALSPMGSLASRISSQFSNSSIIKTLTASIRSSNPSFCSSEVQSSVSLDNPDKGIIVLSHSSLRKSDSAQGPAHPSLQSSKSPEVPPDSAC